MPALPLIDGWEWQFNTFTKKWALQQTHGTVADLTARLTAAERPPLRNSVSGVASASSTSPPASPASSQSVPAATDSRPASVPVATAQVTPPPPPPYTHNAVARPPPNQASVNALPGVHVDRPPPGGILPTNSQSNVPPVGVPRPVSVAPPYNVPLHGVPMRPYVPQPGQTLPVGSQQQPVHLGQRMPLGSQPRPVPLQGGQSVLMNTHMKSNPAQPRQPPVPGAQAVPLAIPSRQPLPSGAQARPATMQQPQQQYMPAGQANAIRPMQPLNASSMPHYANAALYNGSTYYMPAQQQSLAQPVYARELDTVRSPSELQAIPAALSAPRIQRRPLVAQPIIHPRTPQELSTQHFAWTNEAVPPAELPAFSEVSASSNDIVSAASPTAQPIVVAAPASVPAASDVQSSSIAAPVPTPAVTQVLAPSVAESASESDQRPQLDALLQRVPSPSPSHISRHSYIAGPIPDHITTVQLDDNPSTTAVPPIHSPVPSISSTQQLSDLSRNASTAASHSAETSSIHSLSVPVLGPSSTVVTPTQNTADAGPRSGDVPIPSAQPQLAVSTQGIHTARPVSIISPLGPVEVTDVPNPLFTRVPVPSPSQSTTIQATDDHKNVQQNDVSTSVQGAQSPVSPESAGTTQTVNTDMTPSVQPVRTQRLPQPISSPPIGSVPGPPLVSPLVPPPIVAPNTSSPSAATQIQHQNQPQYYNINGQIVAAHQIMAMPQGLMPMQTLAQGPSNQIPITQPPLQHVHTTPAVPTIHASNAATSGTEDATQAPPPLAHTVSAPQVMQTTKASGLISAKNKASSWLSKRGAAANKWVAEHPIAAGAGAVAVEIGGLAMGVDAIKDYRTVTTSINKAKIATRKNQQGITSPVMASTVSPEAQQQFNPTSVPPRSAAQSSSTVVGTPATSHTSGQTPGSVSGIIKRPVAGTPASSTTASVTARPAAQGTRPTGLVTSGPPSAPSAVGQQAGVPGAQNNIALVMDSVSGLGRVAQEFHGAHGIHHQHSQQVHTTHSQEGSSPDKQQEQIYQQTVASQQQMPFQVQPTQQSQQPDGNLSQQLQYQQQYPFQVYGQPQYIVQLPNGQYYIQQGYPVSQSTSFGPVMDPTIAIDPSMLEQTMQSTQSGGLMATDQDGMSDLSGVTNVDTGEVMLDAQPPEIENNVVVGGEELIANDAADESLGDIDVDDGVVDDM